jgi:hypothetical protein
MDRLYRGINESFERSSTRYPGSYYVQVTTTEETIQHPGASPERIARERLILADMLKARQNEKEKTPIKRKSRYKRDPVI